MRTASPGRRTLHRYRRALPAYALVAPALLVLLTYVLLPIADALWTSFQDITLGITAPPTGGVSGPVVNPNAPTLTTFFGIRNWTRLATDSLFWHSLLNSAVFAAGSTALALTLALLAALLVRQLLPFMGVFRALYFVPALLSEVTAALVFLWIYDDNFGLLNRLLHLVNLGPVHWVSDPIVLMIALILVGGWRGASYNLPIMAAGLGTVPPALLEAASIDGAGALARLRHVILPALAPVAIFAAIASIVAATQALATFDVLAGDDLTTLMTIKYIYIRAFYYNDVDYADAITVVLLVVLVALAALQLGVTRRTAT
jgi:ABC-type sugar transport system permease subunit